MIDGISAAPEQLRPGSYLLKAAFVSPVADIALPLSKKIEASTHLLISPMIGEAAVAQVRGGALYAEIEIPVNDLRLMNTRAYLVFEVYPIDESKLSKTNPTLSVMNKDPMTLVDREAAIGGQTFAAPLNFKNEKDASGVIRGTADLAALLPQSDAINSIASQNQAPPDVKQAVQPLAGKTVSRLFAQAALEREQYKRAMTPQKSLGAVVRRSNAEFAFVNNEKFNWTSDKNLQANNHSLPAPAHAIDALLKALNQPLSQMGSSQGAPTYTVTKAELSKAIVSQKGLDERLAAQLCGYFFYTQPRQKVSGFAWNRVEYGTSGKWVDLCVNEVKAHGVDNTFAIEHRLNVLQTGGVGFARGRNDLQFKTGTQLSYAQFQTTSNGWASGFGAGGIMSELSKSISGAAGGAIRIFTAVLGGTGLEMSHSYSDSSMVQAGFGFEYGHSFSIEQTEVNVRVTKYDECMTIRPSATLFSGMQMGLHLKLLANELGSQKAADDIMSHGLMVCGGLAQTKPIIVPERYYTVVSQNGGGTTNDLSDNRNIPWLMQLRGQRDYAAFLEISGATKTSVGAAGKQLDIGDLPNEHLNAAYDKFFAGRMSTMPGFITLEPKLVWTPSP